MINAIVVLIMVVVVVVFINLSGDVGVSISVTINEAGVDIITSLDTPNEYILLECNCKIILMILIHLRG